MGVQGLSEAEAARRLARDGRNELRRLKGKSLIHRFLEQLKDPLIYVLMVAAFVSIVLGEYSDAGIIAAVVLLNACVGLVQEGKARKALEAMEDLQSPAATVLRDGKEKRIPAAHVVLGDIICMEAGDRVPADVKLTEAAELMTEESALTGESLPVAKHAVKKTGDLENGDRTPEHGEMAYASTMVVSGKGRGVVTAVGMQTELGKIADMIGQEQEEPTPLQKRLGELGFVLSLSSLLLCAVLFGIAVLQKRDVFQMLLTAISLAVAAVPEGLPAVVTICLALSVTRLAKAGSIVRRLPSVETLGAVNVVCSDKTGTLTQNQMHAQMGFWDQRLWGLSGEGKITQGGKRQNLAVPPKEFLQGFTLCNNAILETQIGDPTELALLELGRQFGMEREELECHSPRIKEIPFSSEAKKMTTYHMSGSRQIGYCKGAPDVILRDCREILFGGRREVMTPQMRTEIQKGAEDLSRMAYRTLAIAMNEGSLKNDWQGRSADAKKGKTGAETWTFLGLIALGDPPRPEAKGAVRELRDAGVETVMITGDHVATALAIGKELAIAKHAEQCMTGEELERLSEGELNDEMERSRIRIFARVTPAQKRKIVKALQGQGKIVAMTGDGVNDAPSLKAADVGIAMGKNGTDVAKEAADIVLTDDNIATIERAVEEGRGVYENIRKTVIFLLSSNFGELLTMFAAVVFGFASPLKSSHVLWINLITDSLPALALGVDQNDGKALMRCSPRKAGESLFSRGGWGCTCFYGILIAGISLAAFALPELGQAGEPLLARRQTYAFTVLGMSQLFHAIGMRDVNRSVFCMRPVWNKVMLLAIVIGFALQLAVTELPFLVKAFGTVSLSFGEWGILCGLAAMPLIAHEVIAVLCRKDSRQEIGSE
ncbi:MAG: cation-translocating P-type ATPase [Acetatifactor sp.]|nr:cation-translocating P-type ATPase [Acetatifactor sp.]